MGLILGSLVRHFLSQGGREGISYREKKREGGWYIQEEGREKEGEGGHTFIISTAAGLPTAGNDISKEGSVMA